ncbi:uncharacterized protein LOC119113576 [Pollicipes pollicipes]|uniref:uncharacterized protein LOC119113576 n=1 Tax=Pollicipes pollicipes TaxID=41117 RepID=UPI001884C996|nr:uncharacterized protein LOC119113576 [Pollicipes pollicipes]
MVATQSLLKVAGVGGLLIAGAATFVNSKIQAGLKQGAWFRESMRLLRAHPGAVSVLGEPITDGRLDLARPEANFCDERRVQFRVPVRGPKDKGHLLLWGSRPGGHVAGRPAGAGAVQRPEPQAAAPASPSAVPTSPIVAPAL